MARRQREKAERLQRSAELYERGARGEQATAAVLAGLPAEEWTVIHDVRWPGRRHANVDHVVVGPPGVFVIDSKNWSGSITARQDVLRQNGYSRESTVVAAVEAGLALTVVAGVPAQPVLCFVRKEPMTGWARNVAVCSTANVVQMLLTRPVVLDAEQRRTVAVQLDASLKAATEPAPRRTPAPGKPARRKTRSRTAREGRQLIKFVLVAVLFLVLLQSGLLQQLAGAFGEFFVQELASTEQPKG